MKSFFFCRVIDEVQDQGLIGPNYSGRSDLVFGTRQHLFYFQIIVNGQVLFFNCQRVIKESILLKISVCIFECKIIYYFDKIIKYRSIV